MLATRWNCSNSVMGRNVRAEYLWLRTKLSWQRQKKEMNPEGGSLRRNTEQTERLHTTPAHVNRSQVPAGGRLTACWPHWKHRRDFFCLCLWYRRLLALTFQVRPAGHKACLRAFAYLYLSSAKFKENSLDLGERLLAYLFSGSYFKRRKYLFGVSMVSIGKNREVTVKVRQVNDSQKWERLPTGLQSFPGHDAEWTAGHAVWKSCSK